MIQRPSPGLHAQGSSSLAIYICQRRCPSCTKPMWCDLLWVSALDVTPGRRPLGMWEEAPRKGTSSLSALPLKEKSLKLKQSNWISNLNSQNLALTDQAAKKPKAWTPGSEMGSGGDRLREDLQLNPISSLQAPGWSHCLTKVGGICCAHIRKSPREEASRHLGSQPLLQRNATVPPPVSSIILHPAAQL